MQNNFTTFRPEIKDVKKKVELICDTYHVYGIRADIRQNFCDRRMNIHDWLYKIQGGEKRNKKIA